MGSKLNPVNIVIRATNRATLVVNKISDRLKVMQKPVHDLSRAFKGLNAQMKFSQLLDRTRAVGASIAHLARRALLLGSALGVAAVAGMKKFVSAADEIDEVASAAGLGVEALQELRFAAERNGVSAGQLDKGMMRFSRNLVGLRANVGPLNALLKKTSPALLRQLKAARSTEEGVTLLVDAMTNLKNVNARGLLGEAAFGKGGGRLALMADNLEALRLEARETGSVISEETVKAAVQLADESERLQKRITGLALALASELVPPVLAIVTRINEWMKVNQELIRTKVVDFARDLGTSLRALADFLPTALPKMVQFFETIGGAKTVLGSLAAVILGPVIASLVALSAALLASPAGWVAIGIGLMVTGLALAIIHFDKLKAIATQTWEILKGNPLIRLLAAAGNVGGALASGALSGAASLFSAADFSTGIFPRQQTDVGGRLDIRIDGAQGRVEKMKANGPMNLDVGWTMAQGWN